MRIETQSRQRRLADVTKARMKKGTSQESLRQADVDNLG